MQTHGSYAGRGINPAATDATAQFMEGEAALAESKVELVAAFQDLINEGRLFLNSTAGLSGDAVQGARERVTPARGPAPLRSQSKRQARS